MSLACLVPSSPASSRMSSEADYDSKAQIYSASIKIKVTPSQKVCFQIECVTQTVWNKGNQNTALFSVRLGWIFPHDKKLTGYIAALAMPNWNSTVNNVDVYSTDSPDSAVLPGMRKTCFRIQIKPLTLLCVKLNLVDLCSCIQLYMRYACFMYEAFYPWFWC